MTRFLKLLAALFASATVMVSSANAAANQIDVQAEVVAILVAGFSDVSAETGDKVFVDGDNLFDLGEAGPGGTLSTESKSIYLKTNYAGGAEMTVSDDTNNGNLVGDNGGTIAMSYEYGSSAITLGNAFTLSTGIADGTSALETFTATPAVLDGDQTPGSYTTSLTVTLAAK